MIFRDTIIEGVDYMGEDVSETYDNVIFRNCDFRGAQMCGVFIDCIFESNCLFEDVEWNGSFIDCQGVDQ